MSVANQFVDTNIVVYAHDKSAGRKHEQAKTLLRRLWEEHAGCLSIQVLQEFHNVITRRVSSPLSLQQSLILVRIYSSWQVHSPQVVDVETAIELQRRYQISFWDALVLQSASQLACEVLWSEDLSDGQVYGQVQVKKPF